MYAYWCEFNFAACFQILKGPGSLNLRAILAVQVLHKNMLISAVQQANLCRPIKDRKIWNR